MEITKDDLFYVVKTYALISISSKPNVVNIYTTMREQVKMTSLNLYSKLFIKREKSDIIYFNSKGAQAYNFYMIYINWEAKTISIVKKKKKINIK